MPTILTKKSDTPGSVPATGNLTNAAGGAELAVNTADKRLFTLTSGSAVVEIGTNPSSLTCADASFTVARIGSLTISSLSLSNATFSSATITNLTSTSATITNLIASTASATVLRAGSGTITNLLATSLTVSSGSTLNGGVVINELGADADTRIEGDTDANLVFVDASTDRVGVGTSSPGYKLDVNGRIIGLGPTSASSGEGGQLRFRDDTGTFRWQVGVPGAAGTAFTFYDNVASLTRLTLDSSGNLGLGVTPSAWGSGIKAIDLNTVGGLNASTGTTLMSLNAYYNGTNWIYKTTGTSAYYEQTLGKHAWYTAASGTAGNTITFTQAMTLDASSNLFLSGAGTGSRYFGLDVTDSYAGSLVLQAGGGSSGFGGGMVMYGHSHATYPGGVWIGRSANSTGPIMFGSGGIGPSTEQMRLTSGGNLLVGKTADDLTTNGAVIRSTGLSAFSVNQDTVLVVDRTGNDGTLVSLRQANAEEGTISVSGNTVSYNAFAGSHWSQLQDGSKPDILRGTVMESINELCVWPDEENERLPKSKISDTAGSKKVYGVFMAWDNDWTTTNDMYVTAVGAFICRVNGSVTVQEGDLLESNGDGTARVQADDIIRSSTIGKVTSTVKTHEYDDGSYCVPTVLYCG